jgi:hypothetical protein
MREYFDYPVKKDFEKDFIFEWEKETIKYKQATIREYQDFNFLNSEEQNLEILNLILLQLKNIKSKNIFIDNLKNKKLFLSEKVTEIIDTKFRQHKSIFTWIIPKSKTKSLYSSQVRNICKEFNIKWPEELFNIYTLEQYEWMIDWLIFDWNSQDKKTQHFNNEALSDKEWVKSRLEKNKEAFNNIS